MKFMVIIGTGAGGSSVFFLQEIKPTSKIPTKNNFNLQFITVISLIRSHLKSLTFSQD